MYERTLGEYMMTAAFERRMRDIEKWISSRPEKCIILVAHGQVFKQLVGIHPENLGIVECCSNEDGVLNVLDTSEHRGGRWHGQSENQ